MIYKSIDEIIIQIAKYIIKLGSEQGPGVYDKKSNDLSNVHQINKFHVSYKIRHTEDFDDAYKRLEKLGYINTVGLSNIPILKDGKPTEYDSNDSNFYFIIKNLTALKEFLEKIETKYPKRDRPIIHPRALELIAKKIGDIETGKRLVNFLKNNNVDKKLIVYPNAKWVMLYDIFQYLSFSDKKDDNDLLFELIEEFNRSLILIFKGDKPKAEETMAFFSNCLEYDGYSLHEGKIKKIEKKVETSSGHTDRTNLLENSIILQKSKKSRLRLPELPSNLKWEEVKILFLNEHEVIIKARTETFQTNFEAMGFQDEKRRLPNQQWTFLKLLSTKGGELSWDNNNRLELRKINSLKKTKQLLADALRLYFQINEDPFYDYRKEKAYKIKLELIPETNDAAVSSKEENYNDLEIENFFKEQSPIIYEKEEHKEEGW